MNTLSWLLYFAGTFEKLSALMTASAIILWAMLAVFTFFTSMSNNEITLPRRSVIILAIFLAFASCFVPSSKTTYMIIASELGERAINSPQGKILLDEVTKKLVEVSK